MEYVRIEVTLDQPLGVVWGMVSAFGALKAWADGVEACSLEGIGVGSIRATTRNGNVTRERLDAIDAASHSVSYSLLAPYRLPAKDVRATIQLRAVGPSRTAMTWFSEASEIQGSQAELAAYVDCFYRNSIARLGELLVTVNPSSPHPT
jgi:hypothetical protein